MNIDKLNILFVGGGAVGSFYASRFALNCNVSMVCRSNYQTVRENGFAMMTKDWGNYDFVPHAVYNETKAAGKNFDHGTFELNAKWCRAQGNECRLLQLYTNNSFRHNQSAAIN
jgi:Ketopantoate reductase PanE/ApbA